MFEGELEISPKIIHWRNLPVLADGEPLGRLVVIRDITKERALKRLQEDLTDTMVHDLRGPLTAVSISLEALEMMESSPAATPEKRQRAVSRAHASTKKLLGLVESILEISRLESGHMALNHEAVDFIGIVGNVMDELLPVAYEKQIALRCQLPDSLPKMKIDRDLIGRVMQNLIDNALKFTPEGGHVCVTIQDMLGNDRSLMVTIQDSGEGIPIEVQENLFQKFSRGDQIKRGSGLGLYFCRMVVEAHNGRIWLEGSNENGTIIQFKLPLAELTYHS
jgi:signal transduction histidine kinase